MNDCLARQRMGNWAEDQLAGRCSFPIAPLNTWSNAAYPLAGIVLALTHPSSASGAMAVALCFLGVGSGLYHGMKTGWSYRWDIAGMYAVFMALTVHVVSPGHPVAPWLMLVAGAVAAWVFAFRVTVSLPAQMGVFVGLGMLGGFLNGNTGLTLASLGFFLASYAVWWGDQKRKTGRYGHAAWHCGTAVAIALLFLAQTP